MITEPSTLEDFSSFDEGTNWLDQLSEEEYLAIFEEVYISELEPELEELIELEGAPV